jgi:hypothetical protein
MRSLTRTRFSFEIRAGSHLQIEKLFSRLGVSCRLSTNIPTARARQQVGRDGWPASLQP